MVSRRQCMQNLKILFLQKVGGELWVKLAFLCDFGIFCMLICIMCYFSDHVSDHDKYGIRIKLLTVGVPSCVDLLASVVAMATGARN